MTGGKKNKQRASGNCGAGKESVTKRWLRGRRIGNVARWWDKANWCTSSLPNVLNQNKIRSLSEELTRKLSPRGLHQLFPGPQTPLATLPGPCLARLAASVPTKI